MDRLTVVVASTLVLLSQASPPPSEVDIEAMWRLFKSVYGRPATAQWNEPARFAAFQNNVLQAHQMNIEQGVDCTDLFDGPECVFGVTKFSDMLEDEFSATHLGYRPSSERTEVAVWGAGNGNTSGELATVTSSKMVDWRRKGAVTQVKDQGSCGSCWAFSTVEEIESQVFMATGTLPILSTQQIISCDKGGEDAGCDGGDTVTAYKYVEKAGGVDAASDYPDKSHSSGKTGKCTWTKKAVAEVSGFTYATKPCNKGACTNQDEDALAAALAKKGPISVCLNAKAWNNYKRGIFKHKCSGSFKSIDHCVQLVGYNKSGSVPYWIVRNSWNTDWGINGYIHLEMGKNLCGIANEATIVQATLKGWDNVVSV